jgi:SAM-dependent methyltransferase
MDQHRATVREQFTLQTRPFVGALHANDPDLLARYLEIIAPRREDRIIDFCSGPGIVAARVAPLCRRFTCLDLTASMLDAAARLAPSALRIEGDATRAPVRDGVFSIAVSRLAFHHVFEIDEMLAAMMRAVAPGGRIVIQDIVTSEDRAESDETERIERLRDPSHARCLAPSEWRALFARQGIEIESEGGWEMIVDHDEWMNRVYPPEENRREVLHGLEALEGRDRGGMKVWREGNRLMILRRGVFISGRRP